MIFLIFLYSCAKNPNVESTKITLQLPESSRPTIMPASQVKRMMQATSAGDTWGLPDPFSIDEINCWALFIGGEEPELRDNICRYGTPEKIIEVGQYYGGYPSGSQIQIDVPSGSARKFYMMGFKSTTPDLCINSERPAFVNANFSAPQLVGQVEGIDLIPGGETTIDMTVSIQADGKVTNCEGPLFSNGLDGDVYDPSQSLPFVFGDGSDGELTISSTVKIENVVGDKGVPLYSNNRILGVTPVDADITSINLENSWNSKIVIGDMVELYVAAEGVGKKKALFVVNGTTGAMTNLKEVDVDELVEPTKVPGNNKFVFVASDTTNGKEIWVSDGTTVGTTLLKDINPGGGSSNPEYFFSNATGNGLYFWADDGINGKELWKTDGTAGGTILVKDINPGSAGSYFTSKTDYVHLAGYTYFYATDSSAFTQLFRTDGSGPGTTLVGESMDGNVTSEYNQIDTDGTNIYYTARISGSMKLYKYNGSNSYLGKTNPHSLMFDGVNTAYVMIYDGGGSGQQIYKIDASGGLQLFTDIDPGNGISPSSSGFQGRLATGGGNFVFIWGHQTYGREYWISDGTVPGTNVLKDIFTGASGAVTGSYLRTDHVFNGTNLYFKANDGTSGSEFYKSDLTTPGTVLVSDINPGSSNSNPEKFSLNSNNDVYFWASDVLENQLFRYNGTTLTKITNFDSSNPNGLKMKPVSMGGNMFVFHEYKDVNPPCNLLGAGFKTYGKVDSITDDFNFDVELFDNRFASLNNSNLSASAQMILEPESFCRVIVSRVPQLDKLTFESGEITTDKFLDLADGSSEHGGSLNLLVKSEIHVNSGVNKISMSGKGYRGASTNSYAGQGERGFTTTSNISIGSAGGFGSPNWNCGSGGGHSSNGSGVYSGSTNGDSYGCGSLDSSQSCLSGKIYMGGGAAQPDYGHDNGGNGGGIIQIRSPKIMVESLSVLKIETLGDDGDAYKPASTFYSGGGGAGGAAYLEIGQVINQGDMEVNVSGGLSPVNGDCTQNNGGSAGRAHVDIYSGFVGTSIKVKRDGGNGVANKGTCFAGVVNGLDCL
ncbi:MAG: ELWxxDGT repeat protein [Bacteriovoracaceae bacterium]|jgi:ELWxxDGT repeat protein